MNRSVSYVSACIEDEEESEEHLTSVIARVQLGETKLKRSKSVASLFEWVSKQPSINNNEFDDKFLLRFLRASKFRECRARNMMKNYLELRNQIPEWFVGRSSRDQRILDMVRIFLPLPHRDRDGRQIVFCRPGLFNPSKHDTSTLMKSIFIIIDILLNDDLTQVSGIVFVVNLSGFSWSHLTCWTPSIVKKAISCWYNAYPIRVRALHHYNEPFLFDGLFAIIRPFLKTKMLERFHLHGRGTSVLLEYLDSNVLPEECGGTNTTSLKEAEEIFTQRMRKTTLSV